MKRGGAAAAAAMSLVLALSACSGTASDPEGPTTERAGVGDTAADATTPASADDDAPGSVERLRLSATRGSGYPQPFAWVRGPGWIYTGLAFDTLLWEDSTGEPIPWLATDWEVSDDGLEWTFTLHEDATWHDGEPVTADDVAFTHTYMTEGAGAEVAGFAARGLSLATSAEAVDERTVVFTLESPTATFLEDLAMSALIIPEHIWADVDQPDQLRTPEATIGSGPYLLEEADEATGALLYTANEDFHLGSPVVKRLEFVPMEDEVQALERGEVSAASAGGEGAVPEEQLAALDGNEALGSLVKPGSWNRALHFNTTAGFPWDDVRYRHAVAYGIDREDLVERILFGNGEPGSTGGLSPAHPWTASDLPTYARDVDQANALLDELGMEDVDGDGFRELPDGSEFTDQLKASTRFSPKTPELIGEYLRDIGLRVEVQVLEQAVADEAVGSGDYTMTLSGYGGLEGDADSLRTRYLEGSRGGSFAVGQGLDSERFEELATQQLSELDTEARRAMIEEMQQIVAEELLILSLYVPDNILYYDKGTFQNWYYTPGCSPCGGTRNKHMYVTGRTEGL